MTIPMTQSAVAAAKLDPREGIFASRLAPRPGAVLRYLPPSRQAPGRGRAALDVHGGTFPSALSIAHCFTAVVARRAVRGGL